jgi:hypothetical protein
MTDQIISKSLDYRMKERGGNRYMLKRISPIDGSSVTLSATGTTTSTIVIPSSVINLHDTFLRFTHTMVAGAQYNFVFLNTLPFHQIILRDEANQRMVDVTYLFKYMNVVCNDSISQEELLTQDDTAGDGTGFCSGFQCCGAVATRARVTNSNTVLFDRERDYWVVGGQTSATPALNFRIPMSIIKKTFFEMDVNIYHNKSLFLELVWAPVQNYVVDATNVAQPYTGAAVSAGANVTNLYLELAVQINQDIVDAVKGTYNTGKLSFIVPSVVSNRVTRNGAGSQSIEMRLSRAHGIKLLDIYTAPYNTAENVNTSFEHNNLAGARLTSFMPSLNDTQLYSTRLTCADGDDYQAMLKFLKGSMTQNSNIYYYNWYCLSS